MYGCIKCVRILYSVTGIEVFIVCVMSSVDPKQPHHTKDHKDESDSCDSSAMVL